MSAPPPTAPAPVDTTGTGEGALPPWGTPPDAAPGPRQRIGIPRSWGARIWIAAAAAAIAAVSLSATGVLGNDGRTGDPATRSGSAQWSTLQVGNCFEDDDPAGTKEDVSLVPCSHPHNREVIALHDLGSGAWPGDSALDSRGQSLCDPSFQAYVGVAAEASSLQESWYAPLADSWSTTDHVIVCVVAPATGQVAGSLKGSNR